MRQIKRFTAAVLALFLLAIAGCALGEILNVRAGSRDEKRIAITVDDCYHREDILAVIELCRENSVPVTFFPIGKALKYDDRDVWQAAIDAGCEIGNHTWSHAYLTNQSVKNIPFQLLRTQEKLDAILGYHYGMQVMRPPMGKLNGAIVSAIDRVGYRAIVRWDVSATTTKGALKKVRNGSILLFHTRYQDIACLEVLIPLLQARGYQCVTVSQLLGLPPNEIGSELYVWHE